MFQESRAVRGQLFISGMVGRGPDGALIDGLGAQTRRALERIEQVMERHEARRDGIVRLRIYLTDISSWPTVRSEVERFFGDSCPPCTVVGVAALIEPSMLVEVEADAVV